MRRGRSRREAGGQGKPLVEMSAAKYLDPLTAYLRTRSVTATAATRHVGAHGRGTIVALSNPMAGTPAAVEPDDHVRAVQRRRAARET